MMHINLPERRPQHCLRESAAVCSSQYYHHLPIRDMRDSTRHIKSTDRAECLVRAVRVCDERFPGAGFRTCLYGVLVGSDMLPAGSVEQLPESQMTTEVSSFQFGMNNACFFAEAK